VILDDPALGLDPIMRRDFNRDLVTHLQAEGRTVLYSSHLLYEVETVADIVDILHEGRIVRQGTPEDLRIKIQRLVDDKSQRPGFSDPRQGSLRRRSPCFWLASNEVTCQPEAAV
jgi:ABC-2 type transport system ATP-binding protein